MATKSQWSQDVGLHELRRMPGMVIKMTVSVHVRSHLISSSGFFPEPPH
jgi:hypothetical protein